MRHCVTPSLMMLCLLVAPTDVAAQDFGDSRADRSGAWFGLGVGMGSSSLSCDICARDRRGGTAAHLRGGMTLGPTVLLGVEVSAWAQFDEVDQYIGAVTPAAYFYPSPGGGLVLKAGPSISFFSAQDQEGTEVSTTSFGLQVGAGYEIGLGTGYALTPFLDLLATSFGTLSTGDRAITGGAGVTLIHLGLGITFH